MTRAAAPPGVILVGNPNVGKSALFGALTGAYVTVSNYPGTTVEVSEGSAVVGGRKLVVRDTPGSASLIPYSEDERVTRDMLLAADGSAVVLVGDAKNLERALALALEVSETGLPFVLCLNMSDEARSRGISVDAAALAARLGVDVVETVAVRREGVPQLAGALERARPGALAVTYPDVIERAIAAAEPLMPSGAYARRALALAALAGDQTLTPWLRSRLSDEALSRIEGIRTRLARIYRDDLGYVIQESRLRAAGQIAREVVSRRPPPSASTHAAVRLLDRATTHPVWGVPILLAALYLSYLFVGVFGAKTLVDLLENGLFGKVISPAATRFADAAIPWPIVRDFFVGPYGLVTMALAYSLALVFPIVGTFFIAFGVLEDSGYLPRLAVMVNRLFKSMGLNGKAVLPMVLGLGCDTMATLTTRILETPKERLIVILLLALGVPCSAQLTVVLAMMGGLSPLALAIWAFVVLAVLFTVGKLAAKILPGRTGDFVLELPPLRLPRPGNLAVKTLARIEWYLREAVPLFVLGTAILFTADRLRLLGVVENAAKPIVSGVLGLPAEASTAFVIGFLRRDFGAAGLFDMARHGRIDPVQSLVAMVTITLFIPCIANLFMIVKERGWKTAGAIAAFVFPFAVAVGAVLNLFLRAVPLPLK
ncbi:MAG TPA: ferrous iron transport protein B [Thermoanaerobaculia bacterium]|nr:ferrous iron transport protein B [Thermoanaerobaculia bacterium]